MTLTASDAVFPENIVAVIAARIKPAIDADLEVVRRPLVPTDPPQSVGVFAWTWTPDPTSMEIRSVQPTLNRHNIVIQGMIKAFSKADAINIHSVLSTRLRNMFYNDVPLHVGLTALSVTLDNVTERVQRRGITIQRFISREVEGQFLYTSWMDAWVETESLRTA